MIIGLTFNLRERFHWTKGEPDDANGEWDSISTIKYICDAIKENGYDVVEIGDAKDLAEFLSKGERVDLVFNICEGYGVRTREAQVPAMLELLGIPYTFSDAKTLSLSMDKNATKIIMKAFGVPVPAGFVIKDTDDLKRLNIKLPVFVKPTYEGTGKGISVNSIIEDNERLFSLCDELIKKYKQPVLIEEFLQGREFTTGIIGNEDREFIGIMEVKINDPSYRGIYSFKVKEECEKLVEYSIPRDLSQDIVKKIREITLSAANILRVKDIARVDIKCDSEGNPYFLEINPLPGLHPTHGDFPMLAERNGIKYNELIKRIIEAAIKRYNIG